MGRNKKINQRLAQMFWPFDDQKGFSLAEVMVGAGILGALSLVVLNMTTDINRSQRTMESKFQVGQIQSRIHDALRSEDGCANTVQGYTRNASANGIDLPAIQTVIGGNVENLIEANRLYGDYDGDDSTDNYNNLTIGDIKLISYIDEDGSTTNTPEGTTTVSDGAGGTTNVEYGDAIIRVEFIKAKASDASEVAMAQRTQYSSLTVVRDFRIKLRVNEATDEVMDCYAVEDNVTEASCLSLNGVYSPADGKCREIKIQEDPSDPNSVYAITSRGSLLIDNGGGLSVGDGAGFEIDNGANLPGAGNLVLQNDADIRGDAKIGANLIVDGESTFYGNVGVGADPLPDGEPRLYVLGSGSNAGIRVNDGQDQVEILSNSSESVSVQASNSRTAVRIDTNTGNMILGEKNGTEHFRVSSDGQVYINPASSSLFALEIGDSGSSYFPAYIRNQPADLDNDAHWDIRGSVGDEIATKKWAARVIYSNITDTDIENILSSLSTYANNNQLDAIKRIICNDSRSRANLGGVNSPYVDSGYSGGICYHQIRHCQDGLSGRAPRCGNLYVSGINSTGEIFSNTRVRVQGAGRVRLNNNGTIDATSTISSDTLVSAPTVRGTGTSATSGVCSANGCATRFGYQTCPTNAIMVGFAYGRIICTY